MLVSAEDNATIERMIEEGKSAIAIRAAVPQVSRTNVYLKIAKFKKHGTVGRVQTKVSGRPRVINEGIDRFLQGLLAAKPDMELEEMRRHMQDQLQVTVSLSTISRAISRAGIASGSKTCRGRVRGAAVKKTCHKKPTKDKLQLDDQTLSSATPGAHFESTDLAAAAAAATIAGASGDDVVWDQMQRNSSPSLPLDSEHNVHDQHHSSHQHVHQNDQQQQQHQHAMMQGPSHHGQHQEMHALDPSLAQSYPLPYPSVYVDIPRAGVHVGSGAEASVSPVLSHIDVYRSPYAPL